MKLGVILTGLILGIFVETASAAPFETSEGVVERPARSPLVASLELKYRSARYTNFQWGDGKASSAMGSGGGLALEWLPVGRFGGKWTLGMEAAATSIVRGGRRLSTLPLSLSAGYRFDYVENQLFVPFIRGGPQYTYFHENPGRAGEFWSWAWTAGVSLCLNRVEPRSAAILDADYGVNGTYIVLEYTRATPWDAGKNLPHGEGFNVGLRLEM